MVFLNNLADRALLLGLGIVIVSRILLPNFIVIAITLWWCANTVSHFHLHRGLFKNRNMNRFFSCLLSLVLGVPQEVWRQKHLAHHAQKKVYSIKWNFDLAMQIFFLVSLNYYFFLWIPDFLIYQLLPGILVGLGICQIHGYYEHFPANSISYFGPLYNKVMFNDGYHQAHHQFPMAHWDVVATLPFDLSGETSRFPPLLRWLEANRALHP